jgi:hypothetical protein
MGNNQDKSHKTEIIKSDQYKNQNPAWDAV